MTGAALVVQGDALHLPLPDASVDLVVSSPPYWSLRSYSAGPGEIGSESTPHEYLEALWAATSEFMRVLKPTGSAFIDLGDKYNGRSGANSNTGKHHAGWQDRRDAYADKHLLVAGTPDKSLMLLPERYRVGCVDRLGLIARAVIVWNKPNGLPESVTDRVRRSHEDWVHLVKQPRYYSATDEIREPHAGEFLSSGARNGRYGRPGGQYPEKAAGIVGDYQEELHQVGDNRNTFTAPLNPLGKLPGSVWSIPSEPLRLPDHLGVQHYAAFPSEWPRRLILGWSPPGICVECETGRVPVVERTGRIVASDGRDQYGAYSERRSRGETSGPQRQSGNGGGTASMPRHEATILGYACACTPFTDHPSSDEQGGWGSYDDAGLSGAPAANGKQHVPGNYRPKVGPWREYHLDRWTPPPTRPAVVLDPFAGTGTTPMVARALGRIGIGVDLSHDYCRAARWRVFSSGDWQDVIGRTTGRKVKPLPKLHPDQASLL